MASFNSSLFLSLLVVISAFMASPSSVEAQFPNTLNSIIRASGIVRCAIIDPGSSAPPFSNARLELRCGNTSMANTTTNEQGFFEIAIRPVQNVLLNILSAVLGPGQCKIVVGTPLSNCNATLPSVGNLEANVTQVVISQENAVNFIYFAASLFLFIDTVS